MKKNLKNKSFLIPSFLASVTGLGYEKAVKNTLNNNSPGIETSNLSSDGAGFESMNRINSIKNENLKYDTKNFIFSEKDEIYDIIKDNLKNDDKFRDDFKHTADFHGSETDKNNKIDDDLEYESYNHENLKDTIFSSDGVMLPYVIINSSEETSDEVRQENFDTIRRNKEQGINNLGYITTNDYIKSIGKVYSEIDRYMGFYGSDNISGIFFDELSAGRNHLEVDYMKKIYSYVKKRYPGSIVMANSGGTVSDQMAKYSDLWLTCEVSAEDYINSWFPRTSKFENNPANANRIVHVIHSATPEQYETLVNLSKERNAGFLMLTTENLGNYYNNSFNQYSESNDFYNFTENNTGFKQELAYEDSDINDSESFLLENSDEIDEIEFVSSGKYSIMGNLDIPTRDLLIFLNHKNNKKNYSSNILKGKFDFWNDILDEFFVDSSYEIKDVHGNFGIELIKKWNIQ